MPPARGGHRCEENAKVRIMVLLELSPEPTPHHTRGPTEGLDHVAVGSAAGRPHGLGMAPGRSVTTAAAGLAGAAGRQPAFGQLRIRSQGGGTCSTAPDRIAKTSSAPRRPGGRRTRHTQLLGDRPGDSPAPGGPNLGAGRIGPRLDTSVAVRNGNYHIRTDRRIAADRRLLRSALRGQEGRFILYHHGDGYRGHAGR
jgi:hypothetical protein